MIITGLLSAASIMAVSFVGSNAPMWSLYLLVALFGASGMAYNGTLMTFGAELAGKQTMATGLSLVLAIVSLGGFIGPPLFGSIVDVTSSYRSAWLIFGVITAVAALLMMLIKEQKPEV
jgi:MFS family permease